ncbi:hypothetical protein D3C84_700960 [compost metagenome]
MLHVGWIVQDDERRKRGQLYHLQPFPQRLQLELVENGFENSSRSANTPQQGPNSIHQGPALEAPPLNMTQHLETQLKEIRLDFLTAMGETERYKQILEEMPQLKDRVQNEYLEARDRSSRLLGHLRAVEKTLQTLTSSQ